MIASGPIVYGKVDYRSGLTEWCFKIDFNDYGHVTGNYWLSSDNDDAKIPSYIANNISAGIIEYKHNHKQPYYDKDQSNVYDAVRTYEKNHSNSEFKVLLKKILRSETKIILGFVIVGIIALIWIYYEYKKAIPIGYSCDELIGREYTQVVQILNEEGFSNVSTDKISDLSIKDKDKDNVVTDVKMRFLADFDEDTTYPSDAAITVEYHTLELFEAPLSDRKIKGMNYAEVVKEFENAGFTNVSIKAEYDVITGWLKKDGEVESVIINGDKIQTEAEYRPDADVVVYYHTLRKNKY